jgi:methionine-rich copper-binding protein CopC
MRAWSCTNGVRLVVIAASFTVQATAAEARFRGQAILDRAIPAVGATVDRSPVELWLVYNHDVIPALSGVQIADDYGRPVPARKPEADPIRANVLRVRLGRALGPGVYSVNWHVVSRGAPSSGAYRFSVAR